MLKSLKIILVLVIFLSQSAYSQTITIPPFEKVDSALYNFSQTEEPHFLRSVLFDIGLSTEINNLKKRTLFFKVLKAIEGKIDFNFDPRNRPSQRSVDIGEGETYMSNMSPDCIKNKEGRERYRAAYEEYREACRQHRIQDNLKILYRTAILTIKHNEMPYVISENYVEDFYTQANEELLYPEKLDHFRAIFLSRIERNIEYWKDKQK